MSDRAADQVQRMLALVPYLQDRSGVPVEQVARDFDVPAQTIVRDLNVLWFCGLPEAVSGDMIDVDMDALETDGVVRLDNAEYLRRVGRCRFRRVSIVVGVEGTTTSGGSRCSRRSRCAGTRSCRASRSRCGTR